ncbi:MAG TPA: manganese efflux pump [Candidatus Limnocylindrales bacterium]|nr:manganese efflux pump [Candidatus Limnocylindrales bacterium]
MRQVPLTAALLLPLGLDTFALGAALGVAGLEARHRLRVSLVFTLFEAGMPIAGMLLGQVAGRLIGSWAGYAGIAFLALAGLLLLRPGKDEEAEERRLGMVARARGLAIVDLGLSISVDELTVGVSAGLLRLPVVLAIVWIAVQAFAAAQVGMRVGARLGERLRERSERAAGVALIAVAIVLLGLRLLNL